MLYILTGVALIPTLVLICYAIYRTADIGDDVTSGAGRGQAMSTKGSRIVGRVYWSECTPWYDGQYTGMTIDGRPCRIEADNKTKVFVRGVQVGGSDRILYWHLRIKDVIRMRAGLDTK